RSFAGNLALGNRRRREDRVRAAPAVSRAMCIKNTAHEHTGSAENTRPSLRNGFTAYTISSWRPAFLPPSSLEAFASANLTPAPGRRTQTISPYASAALVSRSLRVHRSLPLVCD